MLDPVRQINGENDISHPLNALGLSSRTHNLLIRAGISNVAQVMSRGDEELLRIQGFGPTALSEVRARLSESTKQKPSHVRGVEGQRHVPFFPRLEGQFLSRCFSRVSVLASPSTSNGEASRILREEIDWARTPSLPNSKQ